MIRKFTLFALAVALLLTLAGCGEDEPTGLAADVQGTWVGNVPGDDEIVTEWGFDGYGYHIVTYKADDKSGNVETGSFTVDGSEFSFRGKVRPLSGGEVYHTDYTASVTADEFMMMVEYGDTMLMLSQQEHSEVCPVCKEVHASGSGLHGGDTDEEPTTNEETPTIDDSPVVDDDTPVIEDDDTLVVDDDTPVVDADTPVVDPPVEDNTTSEIIGWSSSTTDEKIYVNIFEDPDQSFTLVMEGKSRINSVDIIDEQTFRDWLWKDAPTSAPGLTATEVRNIVSNDIDLAVQNIYGGVMNTGHVRNVKMEIKGGPTGEFSIKLTLDDSEVVAVADYLSYQVSAQNIPFTYSSFEEYKANSKTNPELGYLYFKKENTGEAKVLEMYMWPLYEDGGNKMIDATVWSTGNDEGILVISRIWGCLS